MTGLVLWLTTLVIATPLPLDRPSVPSAGVATEGGPAVGWVNPANAVYDPDIRAAILYARASDGQDSLGITIGKGALGVGVSSLGRSNGSRRWAVNYNTSLKLPRRLSLGLNMSWHLVGGQRNYVSGDAGLGWRPLPWLGLGAVARNVGTPDPEGLVPASSTFGFAVRPWGKLAVLGMDYEQVFAEEGSRRLLWTARVRPTEGLYIRAHVDSEGNAGVGFETYFGKGGAALHGAFAGDSEVVTVFVGTDEPGQTLAQTGRRVAAVHLSGTPSYQDQMGWMRAHGHTWLEIVRRLEHAQHDKRVRGVLIHLDRLKLSWARFQEVRERIVALTEAGKPVVVYLDGHVTTGQYWAASAATKILAHPAGTLDVAGVQQRLLHVRGALDLIGMDYEATSTGAFKTAPETFTRYEPSEGALEQSDAVLDTVFDQLITDIAAGRSAEKEDVRAWIDGAPWTASNALSEGWVDGLAYPDQLKSYLSDVHHTTVRVRELERRPGPRSGWQPSAKIAVIYIDGVIVPGRSRGGLVGPRMVGSETVVEQLQQAADDIAVHAVVLRVDSPGGSALASDSIWRATTLVQQTGKPVVVSMGGVAASGGYYVASSADAIFAEPTTVTGSIGVYTMKPVLGPALQRVGVQTTTLGRGRGVETFDPVRAWDDVERARAQTLMQDHYRRFKARVAEGRDMSPEHVEALARGRVWTGRAARENGLVDQLGGFEAAIDHARTLSGLAAGRDVALQTPRPEGRLIDRLSTNVGLGSRLQVQRAIPSELHSLVSQLAMWTAMDGEMIWMLAPSHYEVR
ncbi:MAG: protease-4 [Kiritimatiellia bacterium]|jgi:protease-4